MTLHAASGALLMTLCSARRRYSVYLLYWYSFDLLYWYKSTHTAVSGADDSTCRVWRFADEVVLRKEEVFSLLALLVPKYTY
jgi:hypothetical protein